MYGSIRRYRIASGTFDEIANRVKDGLVPLLDRTPGFVSYYVLKTTDDRATSFTICENRAAIDKVNLVALDWVKRNLPNQLLDPEVITGEVSISLAHAHV